MTAKLWRNDRKIAFHKTKPNDLNDRKNRISQNQTSVLLLRYRKQTQILKYVKYIVWSMSGNRFAAFNIMSEIYCIQYFYIALPSRLRRVLVQRLHFNQRSSHRMKLWQKNKASNAYPHLALFDIFLHHRSPLIVPRQCSSSKSNQSQCLPRWINS